MLGELLIAEGKLSARDVERALLAQAEMGDLFGRVLVKLGLVSESDVAATLSRQLQIPLLAGGEFPAELPRIAMRRLQRQQSANSGRWRNLS